jgi:hypothetical protein
VVEDPTIIPAALCPGPEALLAELIVPPSVPKSVRVKLNCASARVIAKSSENTAAKLAMFFVFIRVETTAVTDRFMDQRPGEQGKRTEHLAALVEQHPPAAIFAEIVGQAHRPTDLRFICWPVVGTARCAVRAWALTFE